MFFWEKTFQLNCQRTTKNVKLQSAGYKESKDYDLEMKTITFSDDREVCVFGQGTWNMGRNPLKRKKETGVSNIDQPYNHYRLYSSQIYLNLATFCTFASRYREITW